MRIRTLWQVARPRLLPALLLVLSAGYLLHFVDRGWVPHDEGAIALDAVNVLNGQLPHVQFEDPYTGGLSYLYAVLFRAVGTDLVNIRWLLYVVALLTTLCWYAIFRRVCQPAGAVSLAFIALLWAFPNYFAGLPSWWCLSFASAALLCLLRYFDDARLAWLSVAGTLLGLACSFKQSGIYLVGASLLVLAYHDQAGRPYRVGPREEWSALWLRAGLSAAVVIGLVLIGLAGMDLGFVVRLVVPIGSLLSVLLADEWYREQTSEQSTRRVLLRMLLLGGSAVAPLVVLLFAYWPVHAADWVQGVFLRPGRRGTLVALTFPPLWLSLPALLALVALLDRRSHSRRTATVLACFPLLLVAGFRSTALYQLSWNSVVMLGSAVPVLASVALWRRRGSSSLFAAATLTAFLALFQFPFASPVYFCYVAPLALITAVMVLQALQVRATNYIPFLVALALFALVSLNRGYVWNIGLTDWVTAFPAALDLPGASLFVSSHDASMYRRVVSLIRQHSDGGGVHAFPECPEVYFLSGTQIPAGAGFDFLPALTDSERGELWKRNDVRVVVLNLSPRFSGPPSPGAVSEARRLFAHAEQVGRFEVRWRSAPSEPRNQRGSLPVGP